ncbi:carboxylesterase/lipase family protein [Staphylococcus schweitzeri]|uniref:carboxylesterase/lipase family protein n=1 Tax=Staphylococcus schweitzeri TaxID=1654388 RepID=UPI0004FFFA38|nr:carboxylesterase family protein [Staphylococcus schweitzeri]CDR67658.1 putative carboxylesterase [Staphylococcus schweitzeri]
MLKIESGLIQGYYRNNTYHFLGIPYAEPPVSNLRWKAPRAPQKWKGIYLANEFGPACPQRGGASFNLRTEKQSEDCLYLNVWSTTIDETAEQPVMVWIHGGGNLGGAGSEDAFDGEKLAQNGVTVVTFNYRLGAFGYIADPNIGCNFAVLDQIAALRWVANNIRKFGGNPDNVTIFGESAGAQAVRYLLSAKNAKGLFHKVIIQSAGFEKYVFSEEPTYEKVAKQTSKMFEELGSHNIEELQSVSTERLLDISTKYSGVRPPRGQVHTPANLVWNQVPDGEIISKSHFPALSKDIPILIGCVENEARYFIKPNKTYPEEVLLNMVDTLANSKKELILSYFKQHNYSNYEALDKVFTTVIWFEPCLATIKRFEKLCEHLYYYHFARVSPKYKMNNELAKHTSEIKYIFGNLTPEEDYDEIDKDVSYKMQYAWSTFAKCGVPKNIDHSNWCHYDKNNPYYTLINNRIQTKPLKINQLTGYIQEIRN